MGTKVVVLPGDGIGREVMVEGLRVLKALQKVTDLDLELRQFSSGWQHFAKHGSLWEDGAFEACKDWADVVLHGAVGWPGTRPREWSPADGSVVLDLRYGLDLFANMRPVNLLPGVKPLLGGEPVDIWKEEEVELVIIRENLEGLYSGARRSRFPDDKAHVHVGERPVSREGSRRVIDLAFLQAVLRARRGRMEWEGADVSDEEMEDERYRPSVTCVDKSNVLPGCALFRQVFDEVADEKQGIKPGYHYADAFQLALLQDPARFDVVVTPNLIGDMVTDLAAVLQGGLGMAPSGNLGKEKAMFEPVHGSAPDIAGKGVANPTGMILSIGMMCDWLGRRNGGRKYIEASELLEAVVARHYRETDIRTPDLGGNARTVEVTDSILNSIN